MIVGEHLDTYLAKIWMIISVSDNEMNEGCSFETMIDSKASVCIPNLPYTKCGETSELLPSQRKKASDFLASAKSPFG